MSDSHPSENLSAYESAMLQYMDWLVRPKNNPSNLTDSTNPLASKVDLGLSMNQYYTNETEITFSPTKLSLGEEGQNVTTTGHLKKTSSYYKGYFSTEAFGSYQDVLDALAKPVSSYSLLYIHPSEQKSFTPTTEKKVKVTKCEAIVKKYPALKSELKSKKITRKENNRFPSNVRSLTSTGILDGMLVRYVIVSKEKLEGIIKGSGYLCGCDSCKYSKTLNAYDFERHAGCKTSHPNNHILFANGKTIHQIVQELKRTPDNMLFDAIQTVTGSPINQSAFRAWKESYQPATRKFKNVPAV